MTKKYWINLFIFLFIYHRNTFAELIVTISTGTVQGYEKVSPNGRTFYSFEGIPFAKPPLGTLRFQAPQPVEPWSGTLQATKESNICYSMAKDVDTENEDCLYLNVYTPVLETANSALLPVMVYIYGGGFRDGSSSYGVYGPDYLIEQDIVYVSFNYRLGPFGFLSTNDTVIPGNAGLKDQVLALKWVQENINLFGGDPDKVTIFGQSAGGASVGLLILSKMATGLFRGAIAESGSGVSLWAYMANPEPYGYELASTIDGSVNLGNSQELLQYLQSVDAKTIDNASTKTTKIKYPLPVIEVEHDGAFLTERWYQLLETGDFNQVPLFIGANSEEYINMATEQNIDYLKSLMSNYDRDSKILVPKSMNIQDYSIMETVGEEIKSMYIEDGSSWVDNLGYSIAYLSETHFFNPCVIHAQLQSQYTDVFFYKFSYAGKLGQNLEIKLDGAEKCTHGEELYYYFKRRLSGYDNSDLSQFSNADVTTHNRMVRFWTNFAKYLNPTPVEDELFDNLIWPKMEPDSIHFIDIGTNLHIKADLKHGRYKKWKKLYKKYAVKPLVVW